MADADPDAALAGALALDLSAGPVDWDEVSELLDASYRHVAIKRVLQALDRES